MSASDKINHHCEQAVYQWIRIMNKSTELIVREISIAEKKNISRRAQAKEKAKKVYTETIKIIVSADLLVVMPITMTFIITEGSSVKLVPLVALIL